MFDEPLYKISVDNPDRYNPKATDSIGAVIIFRDGHDVARCQQFLNRLVERGIIEQTTAKPYNSNLGNPVFYIP